MKTILILLFLLLNVEGAETKIPKLVIDNKIYTNVTIKKNIDGVSLLHDSGIKRIDYKKLPPDILKLVGPFDPKEAEQAKREALKNEKHHDKAAQVQTEKAKEAQKSPVEDKKKSPFKPVKVEAAKDIQKSGGLNGAKLK